MSAFRNAGHPSPPCQHKEGPVDTGAHPWVQKERPQAVPGGTVHGSAGIALRPSLAPASLLSQSPCPAPAPRCCPWAWAHPAGRQPHRRLGSPSGTLLQGHCWTQQRGQQPALAGTSLGSPLPAKE